VKALLERRTGNFFVFEEIDHLIGVEPLDIVPLFLTRSILTMPMDE
jgi:hypothetical protein